MGFAWLSPSYNVRGDAMGQSCTCCVTAPLDRRRIFGLAAGAAGLLALRPSLGLAASGDYEAMILGCIDPRIQEPVHRYAQKHGLAGQYSQFVIAGAAVGVVAPKFADWHKAFWDNLAITLELHKIKKLIAIDHRDCGAAKVAYGDASIATRKAENTTHQGVLAEFRKEVGQRYPKLAVETGLMALDGSLMTFS